MIKATQKQPLVVDLVARSHELVSGLKRELGGGDEGADPHEILEASLAACSILTAQLYAKRKKMKLESVDAEVSIPKEGAETEILRKVKFNGELTDEERESLLTIVNKCPIHRLLESHVTIKTEVMT